MSFPQLQCPHCGQFMTAQAGAGQQVKCPACQIVFNAPQAPPPVPPPPPAYAPPAYAPPMGYASQGMYMAKRPNGPATAGLLFSILFFLLIILNVILAAGRAPGEMAIAVSALALLSLLLGLILGIVGVAKTRNPEVGGKGKAVTAICLSGAAMLLMLVSIPILLPSLNRAREVANRVKCAANLKQIGLAMQLYANENRGRFPARPEELLLTQDIDAVVFICPSSNDTNAPGTSKSQQAANLNGHDSYIYLGKGKNSTASSMVILVYEPMTDHRQGFNALFGDGHVDFIGGAMAQKVYSELQAGINPPPSYRYQY